mmetsp:Transcript_76070/g.215581  ORF Transcript_76070/g.215581 Transcript_76070/m.215581 type:complete len:170 (-) Transcript_76070:505-1014(-)
MPRGFSTCRTWHAPLARSGGRPGGLLGVLDKAALRMKKDAVQAVAAPSIFAHQIRSAIIRRPRASSSGRHTASAFDQSVQLSNLGLQHIELLERVGKLRRQQVQGVQDRHILSFERCRDGLTNSLDNKIGELRDRSFESAIKAAGKIIELGFDSLNPISDNVDLVPHRV